MLRKTSRFSGLFFAIGLRFYSVLERIVTLPFFYPKAPIKNGTKSRFKKVKAGSTAFLWVAPKAS